ncbi:MAG: APC family permease, partial [Anaerolineales bacterium]|nr:APC family permease [Anaerolineales bacterium]
MSEVTLFVRKASGLVRSWSMFDAFIYATFSINLITLGLYIFSQMYYFEGNIATTVIVAGAFTIFEVIVYASLISAMPRAGGDYVWQSRILSRGLGFVLAVTGWWFILWLWVPLYGDMLRFEVFTPLLAIVGAQDAALWFTSDANGSMLASAILCLLVFIYIAVGMKWYARLQKISFWGGTIGLALVFILLLIGSQEKFVESLNTVVPEMFGTESTNLYEETFAAGQEAGAAVAPLGKMTLTVATLVMIPYIVFFNLWPNWGSTLYGEVRGATDYKRNFWGMTAAVIVTAVGALIFFALIAKSLGWDWYNSANGAFWNFAWGYTETAPPLPFWPYPAFFATLMFPNKILMFVVILLMSLWWFGWSGTVFLSSTRVIFAAAFDRMLPEGVSYIEPRSRTPVVALALMVIPGLIVAYLFAYNIGNFQSLTLVSTLVIVMTFLGTTVAAVILPWRSKDVFEGSPIAKFKVPSWLGWIGMLLFAAGGVYLIVTSFGYGYDVLTSLAGAAAVTWFMALLVAALTVFNAGVILWLIYYVGKRILGGGSMPLITFAGLIFFTFLDWLLIEWFWDPGGYYGIGWSNTSSMSFMIFLYALAAVIYFGFSAYRKRQGIDVDKVYQEIP